MNEYPKGFIYANSIGLLPNQRNDFIGKVVINQRGCVESMNLRKVSMAIL